MKVSVSILKEINNYKNAIKKVNTTNADYLHIDVLDKTLVNFESFSYNDFLDITDYNSKKLDIHIMSTNLDKQISAFIKLKPEYITFQIESTSDPMKYIKLIKENNIKVGLAIDLETSVNEILPYLNYVDIILVMSVKIGKGGQVFNDKVLNKLKLIRNKNKDILISIDGGINYETALLVKDYVNFLVSGSYITDYSDYKERVNLLKTLDS